MVGIFMALLSVKALMGIPSISHFVVAYTIGLTLALCG
jgi:hypothetical protein